MENNTTRIARLEEQYKNLDKKIEKIISNDLPHLQDGIDKLDSRLDRVEQKLAVWAGAIIILGWIGQALIDKVI